MYIYVYSTIICLFFINVAFFIGIDCRPVPSEARYLSQINIEIILRKHVCAFSFTTGVWYIPNWGKSPLEKICVHWIIYSNICACHTRNMLSSLDWFQHHQRSQRHPEVTNHRSGTKHQLSSAHSLLSCLLLPMLGGMMDYHHHP